MKIGITGGIGSGKSYICDILKQRGYPVYNCDNEAKRLMTCNGDIIRGITSVVGNDAYLPDGTLNKPAIASFLFAKAENGHKINAIVHPVVKADFARWSEGKKIAIMECAILYESGFEDAVDKTVLIYADAETRLHRAMARDNATETQIRERMAAQIAGEEAKRRADYVFDHEDYDTTESEMEKLIAYIDSVTKNDSNNKKIIEQN